MFRVLAGNELGAGQFSEPRAFNVPTEVDKISSSPSPVPMEDGLAGWIIALIVLMLLLLLGICCLICCICLCCFLLGRSKRRDYDAEQKGQLQLISWRFMLANASLLLLHDGLEDP